MIRPVSVKDSQLRDGRLTLFRAEIRLAESQVIRIHGKPVAENKAFEFCDIHRGKTCQGFDSGGNCVAQRERFWFAQRGLPRFYGIDNVFPDLRQLFSSERSVKCIDLCRAHQRAFSLRKNLDTLGGRVCPLIELSGEIFHCKNRCSVELRFLVHKIELRF